MNRSYEKISFVIPLYDEKDNLLPLFEELRQVAETLDTPYEILFIDDGSTDGCVDILRRLAGEFPNLHYCSFRRNLGQSAALACGFREAQGDVIVTMDGDRQNDPADIPLLLEYYRDCDMVNGWRKNRRDTQAKRIGSKIGNWVRNRLTGEEIRDTGCSLKVMKAAMVKRIPMFRGLHRFLPTLMRLEGAKIVEVPVNHRPRVTGTSKYTNYRRAIEGFYDLLAVRWMMRRHLKIEGVVHERR